MALRVRKFLNKNIEKMKATLLPITVSSRGLRRMKKWAQEKSKKHMVIALFSLISLILLGLIYTALINTSDKAFAQPNKATYCTKNGCHALADADATMWAGRDGISLASGTGSPSVSVFIGAGRTVEFDWYGNNFSNSSSGYGAGVQICVPDSPSNWTIATGTTSNPGWAGWKTAWDQTDGVSWNLTITGNLPSGYTGKTVNYANTDWDYGTNDGAYDDGSGAPAPNDLDGTANSHGVDANVTVDGSASGDYSIYLDCIGHDGASNKKSNERATVSVYICNITSLSTDKSSYNTLGEDITVTGNYNNTSTTTNLSSSSIDYQIFIDSNTNGDLDSGETYIDSSGNPQTASTGNETTKVTSSFNVNANTTQQDQWSISNQNFTSATDYTLKAIWKESNGGVIDIEDDTSPYYTFYSVPTLGVWLTIVFILFVIGVSTWRFKLNPIRLQH